MPSFAIPADPAAPDRYRVTHWTGARPVSGNAHTGRNFALSAVHRSAERGEGEGSASEGGTFCCLYKTRKTHVTLLFPAGRYRKEESFVLKFPPVPTEKERRDT